MVKEEAVKILKEMLCYENYVFSCIADDSCDETAECQRNVKALQMAIEALEKEEKEIPKKPVMQEGNRRDLFCASCGTRVSDVVDRIIYRGKLQKFCGVCGGEIDWSEDK